MATERTYTIPLRREWLKAVKYQRAKKAIRGIKEFLKRHMNVEMSAIKLGNYLNLEIWKHGIKNPPSKIRVNVTKDDKGIVSAEIVGAPVKKVEAPKKGAKAPAKPAAVPAKPAESKPVEKKPEAKAETKPAEKKAEPAEKKPEVKKEVKPEPKPAGKPQAEQTKIIQ